LLAVASHRAQLQSDKGKELVKAHKGDAQKVHEECQKHCLQPTGAATNAGDFVKHITTACLGSAPWNGTAHSFVLHFIEQMRLCDMLVSSADQIPPGAKQTLLQNAVLNHGELSTVANVNRRTVVETKQEPSSSKPKKNRHRRNQRRTVIIETEEEPSSSKPKKNRRHQNF
jgi:hypothetical protein